MDRIALLPDRFNKWLVAGLRRWLGIEAQEAMLVQHLQLLLELAMQGNETAQAVLGAKTRLDVTRTEQDKIKRRVLFYAEHCAALHYTHEKFERVLREEKEKEKK